MLTRGAPEPSRTAITRTSKTFTEPALGGASENPETVGLSQEVGGLYWGKAPCEMGKFGRNSWRERARRGGFNTEQGKRKSGFLGVGKQKAVAQA